MAYISFLKLTLFILEFQINTLIAHAQTFYKNEYTSKLNNSNDLKYFERITNQKLSTHHLLNQLVGDLLKENMRNGQVYINNLLSKGTTRKTTYNGLRYNGVHGCQSGFRQSYVSGYCEDVNECIDSRMNRCDSNAVCLNTFGSYKCKCGKGYIESRIKGQPFFYYFIN